MSERLTSFRPEECFSLPAKAATEYFKGRMLGTDGNGRAVAAIAAAGLIVVGIINSSVDNIAGAHGDKQVPYRVGTFLLENDPAAPLTQAHVNKPCFLKDDITVSADPGAHNVVAGIFRGFHNNGDGVWIDSRYMGLFAVYFGSNTESNWRLTAQTSDGASILQLWNQTQQTWQTVQLEGAAGAERLVIEAAA